MSQDKTTNTTYILLQKKLALLRAHTFANQIKNNFHTKSYSASMEYKTMDEAECSNLKFLEKYLNGYGLNNYQIKHSFDENNNKNCRLNVIFTDTTLNPQFIDTFETHKTSWKATKSLLDFIDDPSSFVDFMNYDPPYYKNRSTVSSHNIEMCKLYRDLVDDSLKDVNADYSELFYEYEYNSYKCNVFMKL